MLRSMASKVAWMARTTTTVVGLAIMLALVFGVGSMAFAANGQNFVLGVLTNTTTAMTKLTGNVSGKPVLQIVNPNTAAGSQALQLLVADGKPPLVVNPTAGKAINLNADKLDGKDSQAFLSSSTYTRQRGLPGTANAWTQGSISCDAGDRALSGGYWNVDPGTSVERSLPNESLSSSGWYIGYNNDATADEVWIMVVCADMTP
jgi:hypothetical protein